MKVTSLKTHPITSEDHDLLRILDQYLENFPESSILVIASKIVAITQGRVAKLSPQEKDELIKKEAQLYLPPELHKHHLYITIKDNILTYSSGIDESNGNGLDILWPENMQKVVSKVRAYLVDRFKVKNAGVIITDMTVLPLRWGIIGGAVAYSGFNPLKDLTGESDVFGREFKFTKVGILNGLAAAAAVVMGEGSEQTPLGIIEEVPFVEFQNRDPSKDELAALIIKPEEDLFGPMINAAPWQKGGSK